MIVRKTAAEVDTMARAGEVDPSNAMVLVNAGTVHLMSGDRDRARDAFEAALRKNPRVARAHSSLGVVLAESGRAAASAGPQVAQSTPPLGAL